MSLSTNKSMKAKKNVSIVEPSDSSKKGKQDYNVHSSVDMMNCIMKMTKMTGDANNLTTDDIFRMLDLYFNKEFYTYRHLHNSYDKFIDDTIPRYFTELSHPFDEYITENKIIRHKFKFENVIPEPPKLANNVDPMFPADARNLGLTYSMTIYADVTQIKEVVDINSTSKDNVTVTISGKTEHKKPIVIVPVMVRSKYCNLNVHKEEVRDECQYDPGGYFIVNGSEKIVICQDRMIYNQPMVFVKKNSSVAYNVVQVNSKSNEQNGIMQTVSIKIRKDNVMIIKIPILMEVNVMTIFRALGIESDKDIIQMCTFDSKDRYMTDILRASLENCVNDELDHKPLIQTEEEAIDYLITKLKVVRKYTESNQRTKLEQKKIHLMELLKASFLPHMDGTLLNPCKEKAYFLGYMIKELLDVELKRKPIHNRDSYCKKRVDNINELLEEILIQQDKNNKSECNKQFSARIGDDFDAVDPYNVIHQYKATAFEQGFKSSLMIGNWPRKKGVSQMLQRFSYMQLLSFLSRIDSQSGQSASKLTKPRQVDPSSVPFLCVTGDTEVLMSDNSTVELIKNIKDNQTIRSVSKCDLSEINTPIKKSFNRKEYVIEIETITGRKIKCTRDHPLLTLKNNKYVMVNAGDLHVDDKVIIRHFNKYLPLDKETHVELDQSYDQLKSHSSLYGKNISQTHLEITARLIGAIISNGNIEYHYVRKNNGSHKHIQLKYSTDIFVNDEHDLLDIYDDLHKLGFKNAKYIQCDDGKTLKVTIGYDFSHYMILMGAPLRNMTYTQYGIPKWILNGNNRIKREFLSGLTSLNYSQDINRDIKFCEINKLTSINSYTKTTLFMKNIESMYNEFGVDGYVSVTLSSDKKNYIVSYCPNVNKHNMNRLTDIIKFCYNYERSEKSAIIIEFIKYRAHRDNTNDKSKCMSFNEFKNNYCVRDNKLAIPIKNITQLGEETVYDFETALDSHTFIANSFVVSNCNIQTPEHAKIGLIKHLSMIGSITIGNKDDTEHVRMFIMEHPDIKRIYDVPASKLKNMVKVFLNGEWLGVIENKLNVGDDFIDNPSLRLYADSRAMKISGKFNREMTSIAFDHNNNEIRFCTDSGRLYRPVLRINGDNELMLTKDHIDRISLNPMDRDKITDWDEFCDIDNYPIEFIDSEEQPYLMIAEDIHVLNEERKKIIESENYKFTDENEMKVINRYGKNTYIRFDAMEIHPSVLLGEIATNIPFCNRNQAPRNIFQYAQGRQGMGIYCTTYRSRTDISYVLYNPEIPLVNTRTSKYTYADHLPPGSNAIVAIACYSGYNQEDSLVFNKTALERGLFTSLSLKKYIASITKNHETSGDDKFMKPPPEKTIGIKSGQYDKMNEKGFVPEETHLTNGDVIFGKVTPIGDANDAGKIFRDSSEQYKSQADGVVDRVYTGIKNADGFETRKALVRSERFPHIGDKFCCYTPDHEVLTTEGWIPFDKLTMNHKVAILINGNTMEYHEPLAIQKYEYNGEMYQIKTNMVNLCVTPNHNMWVKNRPSSGKKKNEMEYKLERADQIIGKRRFYKKNVEKTLLTENSKYINKMRQFVLPGVKNLEPLVLPLIPFLSVMGIWFAEGSMHSKKWAIEFAVHKQRVKDELEKQCALMNIKVHKHIDNGEYNRWCIPDKRFVHFFDEIGSIAIHKTLPSFVWELWRDECVALLNGMLLGDGHTMANGTRRYDTSSTKLADDFQKLCLHAGFSANKTVKEKAGHTTVIKSGKKKGQMIRTNVDSYRLTVNTAQNQPIVNKTAKVDEMINYNGFVYCCTALGGDNVIYVRRGGISVWCGNSKHGQKGTLGLALDAIDMPFTRRGIRPDIIVNTNAIPSRMTVGQLCECLFGKVGALKGTNMDGTAFEDYDIESVKDELEKFGFNRECEEIMYNGMTGDKLKVPIFIGPTYYQRLKHLVQDKIHSRSRGPVTLLTRQAPEGRSKDGGLRFGEMERDAVIAHGMAKFLKERLFDCADPYSTRVCGKCGMFARREEYRKNQPSPGPNDVWHCPMCFNYTDIHEIMIPYAFKLMIQELLSMNIAPRIIVEKSIVGE
jgi:DNA-directed RNA polymerase beta subunit/intein/homing endonuclease